jgi:hypothetical protein
VENIKQNQKYMWKNICGKYKAESKIYVENIKQNQKYMWKI